LALYPGVHHTLLDPVLLNSQPGNTIFILSRLNLVSFHFGDEQKGTANFGFPRQMAHTRIKRANTLHIL
jgi:hypothetical protein